MTEPVRPLKKNSPLAVIGAGIAGLLIFIALVTGFHGDSLSPVVFPDVNYETAPPPVLEADPPAPWVNQSGINLPPMGNLPSLQTAAQQNPILQRALDEFSAKNDAQIFADYARTDADITAILLLWAGADLDRGGRTRDGVDTRVAIFLRRVYGLSSGAPILNNPRLGDNPWPRLFSHYKVRLIAQTKGGSAPFTGTLRYDVGRDQVMLENGGLNRRFFSDFGRFIRTQKNSAALRRNLLSYVDMVDITLAQRNADTIELVR